MKLLSFEGIFLKTDIQEMILVAPLYRIVKLFRFLIFAFEYG